MHTIRANNTADAWKAAINTIDIYGTDIITEDGQLTREVTNLMIEIKHPNLGYPIPGSGWNMEALDVYSDQIMDPKDKGFVYDYGSRLARGGQIPHVVKMLRKESTTRRAILSTRVLEKDMVEQHTPCLQIVEFLHRQGKLNMTCYFRSHDIKAAYPANIYGLYRLLESVAILAEMKPGGITTISASAHYYVE
jgi:thymidylate synthase (methanogen type)